MSEHYLGIDIGSSYTKFVVIDNTGLVAHISVISTLSRHRKEFDQTLSSIDENFSIAGRCATGYGRRFIEADLQKTELVSASAGVSFHHPVHKCILDIGGEDIKIIESGPNGEVINFFMNDKCSAGTGTFITEIAERAELELTEMSDLARKSTSPRIMNSFCTVFAKSEILGWKFEGAPIEDIARGIYLSVVDRICKLPLNINLPVMLCGGVIAYHPYLTDLLSDATGADIEVVDNPQCAVALGAAVLARQNKTADQVQMRES